jgi:poly(3-hydroxybutyrate) depolymerase
VEGRYLTPAGSLRSLAAAGSLLLAAALAAFVTPTTLAAEPPAALPALDLAGDNVTVSGVSSGGYMAHQFHIAHAATVLGAGIIAGGPYGCAGDDYPWNFGRVFAVCAKLPGPLPWAGPPAAARSVTLIRTEAAAGRIADPATLAESRVYLFSGSGDGLVPASVVAAVGDVYAAFLDRDRIRFENRIEAAHAMVTLRWGNACRTSKDPFINDCDFDLAAAIFDQLLGPAPAAAAAESAGEILRFDQRPFLPAGREAGLADAGYLYVPAACRADGSRCRLHVAFHGCNQDRGTIGDAFVRHAGYNHAADSHAVVVLYPQTRPLRRHLLGLAIPWPNPQACWDWWGFTGPDYATRTAPQIQAVKAMIDRLSTTPDRP